MVRNQSGQFVNCELIDLTGAAFTGIVTVYVTIDNGAKTLGTVGSGIATNKGDGLYQYAPSQAETNGAQLEFSFRGTGAAPAGKQIETFTAAQIAALTATSSPTSVSVTQIITNALLALNVYAPGQSIKSPDADFCLGKVNGIFDDWNAERGMTYAEVFSTFTTTPALNPHTIGPTGTWVLSSRPVSIDAMALSLGNGIYSRIRVHTDPEWWATQYTYASTFPTDVYYSPDEPNGSIYFQAIPSSALSIRVMTRTVLASVALTDILTLPQGYQNALELTLMEAIAETFGRAISPRTEQRAAQARGRIMANNIIVPSLVTRRSGMQGGRSGGYWDYRIGGWR